MKSAKAILVLILMAGSISLYAQKKQGRALIDSLLAEVPKSKDDTSGAKLLDEIAAEYNSVNPDEGLRWAEKDLALARKIGWSIGIGNAYNNIGNNYQGKGLNPQALDAFFKSLKVWEGLNNKEGIGVVSGNIGIIYKMQKDYPKALEYYFKALKIAEERNSKERIRSALGNIGNVYEAQGRYNEALEFRKRALSIAETTKNRGAVCTQTGNIAATYLLMKQYPAALVYCFRGLRLAGEEGDQQSVAANLGNIGEIYVDMARDRTAPRPDSLVYASRSANLAKGVEYLRKGIIACRSSRFNEAIPELSRYLSEALVLQGDYQAALAAYQQYTAVQDSLYNIENNTKIAGLETQRAVELKDKQIEIDRLAVAKKRNERGFFIVGIGLLLAVIGVVFRNYRVQKDLNGQLSIEKKKVEQHTEELDVANHELNSTLQDLRATQQQLITAEKLKENEMIRSRISQDIHDDISSELTRISWVSELAKAKMKKDEYQDMPGLLEKITDSSRETVTKLGEIIWTVNPQNDSLASLLAYMRSHINKFFADTAFSYTIDFPDTGVDVHMNPELKRNLYLVMKEALNNVVKYSGAKQVHIALQVDRGTYRFCINDDGRGIEEGVVQGGGNGLGNMRRRMESVQGCCAITSSAGNGTEICCSGTLY